MNKMSRRREPDIKFADFQSLHVVAMSFFLVVASASAYSRSIILWVFQCDHYEYVFVSEENYVNIIR